MGINMINRDSVICKMFDIDYPIIQGGMAWVSDASLAAAVSEAGGLGVIAAGHAPADWVREQIRIVKQTTNKPFGVNIMLLSPFVTDVANVLAQESVPVIITGAGNPAKYMKMWKESGAKIAPVVPSTALALMMQKMGADAVIAEGCEAGGHIGELTTMVLTPAIVDAVDIPVIAAGGIYDARTAMAVFCLGAVGIQVGTRFILAKECTTHQAFKDKLIKAKDIDSKVTGRVTGHPVRLLRNKLSRKMQAAEYEDNAVEVLEEMGAGSLRKAVVDGDLVEGSFMAGQVACMLKEEQSAEEIIQEIFSHSALEATLGRASEILSI